MLTELKMAELCRLIADLIINDCGMHVLRLIQLTLVHKLRHFGVMTVNAWLAL
jgi:hypothetical protein